MNKEIVEQWNEYVKTFDKGIDIDKTGLDDAFEAGYKRAINKRHNIHKINLECARNGAKLNEFNRILKDKEGFWINAITKELCYRQRIIGVIQVEDGEIRQNTPSRRK